MKKILLLILVALVTYSSSFAIGGFKVVIKKPGAAVDVQVRIVDYSSTGPTTEFTGATVSLTPNASGIIVASVPETPTILATDVNSFYIVEVWTGSPLTLSSQQRLDEMIFEQAQTGLTDNEGNVTLEPGKELIFPEPAGSGENFTSFKSPALAADVEYTLPINDGDANQYLKTDGSGVMSWDNPTVSTNTTIDGNGLTGSPLGLADNAVTSAKLNDGAVTTAKINNDAVTTGKIATGAVTTDKIGSSAVTDVKIGTSAVTTAKINNDAVTTGKIATGAVTTDKIGSSAVTDVKIGTSAVTTAKINNAAVTTDKINDGAVTEAKLADNAVATAKIEDKAVTAAKISPGATNGHVLTVSGTDAVWAAPAGGGGGGATHETQTMTSSFAPLTGTYQTMGGISFNLDANSIYLVRGEFQEVENGGTSGKFDISFPYTGTLAMVHFDRLVSGGVYVESTPIESLSCDADNSGTNPSIIQGMIITNAAGTMTLQFRKNATSPNDVNINSGGQITLIKL